ncbi:hypothetical protein ABZ953_19310 [Streptomyces sp. NPDC046465]|uniref:NucA/NucB deoxyribonuclease domain-containing protein n=1 Tax=Streptomyces sp. NPDC046465 TaxID=3155810 RepID=UPI0033D55A24
MAATLTVLAAGGAVAQADEPDAAGAGVTSQARVAQARVAQPPPQGRQQAAPEAAPGPRVHDSCRGWGAVRARAKAAGVARVVCVRSGGALSGRAKQAASRTLKTLTGEAPGEAPGGPRPGAARGERAQPLPLWCASHVDGQWWFTRRDACAATPGSVIVRDVNTGAVTGTMEYHTVEYTWAPSSGLTSVYQVSVTPHRYTGTSAALMTLLATGSCRSNCTLNASPPVREFLAKDRIVTREFGMDATTTGPGARGQVWSNVNLAFAIPNQSFGTTRDVQSLPIRCDNDLPGNNLPSGCVFEGYEPLLVLHYDDPELGWNALHVGWAIYSGLPSRLNRLANIAESTPNRDRACPRGPEYPRPAGYQCDEYPFASTQQGAKTSGTVHAPRTFGFCQLTDQWPNTPVVNGPVGPQGWSRCNILEGHNDKGGKALNAFYLTERILPGDPFDVATTA